MRSRAVVITFARTSKAYILGLVFLLNPMMAYGQIIPDLDRLVGKNLEDAYLGQTIDGIYKRPRERSGTHEFTESFYADGTTYYREASFTQEGRWYIENRNTVCFTYENEGPVSTTTPHCFAIYESGTCQYAYAINNVRNGKPIHPNAWTAKTLIQGDISTCDNLIS